VAFALDAQSAAGADSARREAIAIAKANFPAVMNRKDPARFLVLVFDSAQRYRWGFPVNSSLRIGIGADTLTGAERTKAREERRGVHPSNPTPPHAVTMTYVAYRRDSAQKLVPLPLNAGDGLVDIPLRSIESGIAGILASNVVYADHFLMYPNEDPSLYFDIVALHLNVTLPDTGRPALTRIPQPQLLTGGRPRSSDPSAVPGKKKASVKTLVLLPVPVPEAAKTYEFEACFEVKPDGKGTLLTWTRSLDLDYNTKVRKTLDKYQFRPATLNGVPVTDTTCVRAKNTRPPG
jgi:hypothetical protein